MTTEQQPIVDLLRPLAERRAPCHEIPENPLANPEDLCPACGMPYDVPSTGTRPDARFKALRRPVALHDVNETAYERRDLERGWFIDTSLGATVRAAAACGLTVRLAQKAQDQWEAVVDGVPRAMRSGDSPEEAVARALAAAVER